MAARFCLDFQRKTVASVYQAYSLTLLIAKRNVSRDREAGGKKSQSDTLIEDPEVIMALLPENKDISMKCGCYAQVNF